MKKEMNNKGFSLVELIIVIAIMAVLVGVLAPQFIKYVEKSKVSADGTTMDEYVTAMEVLASDPDVNLVSTATYTVTTAGGGSDVITVSADLATLLADTITDTPKLKSTTYKASAITIKLEYDSTNKVWKVTKTGMP